MDLENCFIGKAKESDKCHKIWYVKRKELLPIAKLKQNELELVEWRSGVKVSDCIYVSSAKLCLHHYQVYMKRFEKRQTKCCNIFQCHSGVKMPKARHLITLAMAKTLVNQYKKITPGFKLCITCYKQAKKEYSTLLTQMKQSSGTSETDESEFATTENDNAVDMLNSNLHKQNISPIKLHSQPQRQKVKQAKQKLSKAAQNLQASFSSVGISVSPVKVISQSTISSANCSNSDLDTLMNELKSKFQSSSYQEKIQILTLKPDSWTTEKTSTFFHTTKHAVKKAISLKKEEDILSMTK